jgi:hypothetical protein
MHLSSPDNAGALAFGMLGTLPPQPLLSLLFMTLGELAIAFSDVVIDGVVVEMSRWEDQATAGSLQSLCWGSQVSWVSDEDMRSVCCKIAAIRADSESLCGRQWAC